jgi:hypothetical protein
LRDILLSSLRLSGAREERGAIDSGNCECARDGAQLGLKDTHEKVGSPQARWTPAIPV